MMRSLLRLCLLSACVVVACAEPAETEPLARGRQLYRQLDCARCHVIDGSGGWLGPSLTHAAAAAEERRPGDAGGYLREAIIDPGAYIVPGYRDTMPRGYRRQLGDADIDALVLYLNTLR